MTSTKKSLVSVMLIIMIAAVVTIPTFIWNSPSRENKFSPSSIVWSEDFSDNNYDGWTVCRGGYSAADGVMRGTTTSFNWAHYDSDVVVGTWSYDFYHTGVSGMSVWFMCTEIDPLLYDHPLHGYFVDFASPTSGQMQLMLGEDSTFTPLETITWSESFSGWVHFDIQRFSNATIKVYMDSVLKLEATDTTYNEASYFYLQGYNTQGIDNITIDDEDPSNTITTTSSSTETTTSSSTASTSTTSSTTDSSPNGLQIDNMLLFGFVVVIIVAVGAVSLRKRGSNGRSTQIPSQSFSPPPDGVPIADTDSKNLVLGALKSYPRVSMSELESLLKLPSDQARRITLMLIAEGKVSGAFDRSMDEFVSVSATQIGRNLSEGSKIVETLPTCLFCAAPLSKPLGAGESTTCPNCGKILRG